MPVVLQGIDNAKKISKTGVPGAGGAPDSRGKTDWLRLASPVSNVTTYEGLKTTCRRWPGDMTDIVDQQ